MEFPVHGHDYSLQACKHNGKKDSIGNDEANPRHRLGKHEGMMTQCPIFPMSEEQVAAHRHVARALHSPAAGSFASQFAVLCEQNNVGGANLGLPLTLEIKRSLFYTTCKDFTGEIRQLGVGRDPRYEVSATGLFFTPGSVQIMGARSDDAVRIMIHKICQVLRENGHSPSILFLSIDNKVASGLLGCNIHLERLHRNLPGFSTVYEPDKFPGIICTYQAEGRVVTFMVFENGKVMGLGIQDMLVANAIYIRLLAMVREFRAEENVEQRRNKSAERIARQRNVDRRSGANSIKRATCIAHAVQVMLEENIDRANDTSFALEMGARINAITSKRKHDDDDDDDD